jgi:hypothetical protein
MSSTLRFDTWQDSDGNNRVSGFNARSVITATNASWPVPDLGSPWVKVTVIGGGGGGGGANGNDGATGGTTTFNAGGAGTVTATGGAGGNRAAVNTLAGKAGTAGFASGNGGMGGNHDNGVTALNGNGGFTTVSYLDLTGVSTVNVTVGAGGAGGTSGAGGAGGAGGRGEVIVEYVAA